MDTTTLNQSLSDIIVEYFSLKSIESHYLFKHSQDLIKRHPRCRVQCKIPQPASDITTLSTTRSLPCLKTTNYHPTNIYKLKDDTETLTYIPLTKDSGNVLPITESKIFTSTPFEAKETDSNIIEGKHFALFLCFKIYQLPGVSNQQEVVNICQKIFRLAKKNTKLLPEILKVPQEIVFPPHIEEQEVTEYYDKLCRICKTYMCFIHFSEKKPEYQSDISKNKREENKVSHERNMDELDPNMAKIKWWQNRSNVKETGRWLLDFRCSDFSKCSRRCSGVIQRKITPRSKFIIKKMLSKGVRNSCSIAYFIGYSCIETAHFIESLDKYYQETPTPHYIFRLPATDLVSHKSSIPAEASDNCSCKGECGIDTDCNCFERNDISRLLCNKFCECSNKCRNKFLGCNCQMGQCGTNKCLCFANQRECDPDLCLSCCSFQAIRINRTGSLLTSGNGKFSLCKNIKTQLGIRKRTGLSLSTIPYAGLGLFALEDIKKDEFIMEYTGELLSSSESERKGSIYDAQEHSYIFGVGKFVIDATYLGNKMRFVNHKSHNEQNCDANTWAVNGNSVIILKAKKNIKKGEELFFDYGYNLETVTYKWYKDYEDSQDKKIKTKKNK